MSPRCLPFTTKYCKRFPRKVEGISDLLAASGKRALTTRRGGRRTARVTLHLPATRRSTRSAGAQVLSAPAPQGRAGQYSR